MRKLCLLLLTVCFAAFANAQVTVTNPGNTTPGLAATYGSLAAAITDLNLQTAISGPVTITLDPANPQTTPVGGYSITAILTGASAVNTVTFEGSGNTITAFTPQASGILHDAIFEIIGSDFITIQNFVMQENAANTTTAAGTNNMTEWGVALLYASTTNGAQNITIQNNTIDLNRTYQNTFGIYSNSTHTATTVTTSATATTTAGGNSGLKIYTNTITDVNMGIVVVGPTAVADMNTGVDIGGAGAGTGNTITNFGTTTTGVSGYANLSITINGILIRNSLGFNVSYNSLTSSSGAAGVTAGTLNGIQIPAASTTGGTTTVSSSINNNTLALTSHVLAGAINGINLPSGYGTLNTTITINANNFTTLNHTIAAATGTITAITQSGSTTNGPITHSISNNTFTNLTSSSTGSFTFISNNWARPTGGTGNINNNSIVTAFNKTGAGGTLTLYNSNSTSGATINEINTGNNFSNITVTGATTIAGWASTDGGSPTKTVTGNTFNNWSGGTSAITALSVSFSGAASVSGNTITNITGTGNVTGLASSGGTQTISNNTINSLSSSGASGVVIGISISGGTTQIVSGHTIHTLSASGATSPQVNGILVSSGTTVNLFKNKIYGLSVSGAISTTSPAVNGISLTGGTTVNTYNNLIGELTAPLASLTDAIRGISVSSTSTTTTQNVYYNSVNVSATSTGANFGTTGIFHAASATATTATLNLRNNILVNNSTPAGTGVVTVFRRSAAATLGNYGTASNNNDFYTTTGSVMHDGTTAFNIAAFKAAVAPRDATSFSEDPEFQSTSGANANFLKYRTDVSKQIESGAVNIATFTDDYAGTIRQGNGGYTGTGTAPDIGAWELEGIGLDLAGPVITYTTLINTLCLTAPVLTATITDPSVVNTTAGTRPRLYYKKSGDANTFNDNTNGTDGWKYVEAAGVGGSPFSFTADYSLLFTGAPVAGETIQYFVVAQDQAGTPNVGINSGIFNATPVSVALTAGAFPLTGTINSYSILAGIAPTGITVGSGGTYNSLTEAGAGGLFAAINAGGLTANTTITVISNTTETGAVALNQLAYGCAGPYTLTIVPQTATSPVVSGTVAGPMINLNGADNVIFDGSNNGSSSKDMTFSNTNTGGSVFQFINDATTNTVKNSIILGVNSSAASGSIVFSTSTGSLGNSSNIINNNDIRDGATVPVNAIYSSGTGAALNASNTISDNNIFNWTGSGILVSSTGAGNSWAISNNNVYQTAARTSTLIAISLAGGNTHTVSGNKLYQTTGTIGAAYTGISITGATNGHTISSNSIGGAAANRSGTALEVTSSSTNLTAILLSVGTTTATNVNSNTVSNISTSTTSTLSSVFGVSVTGGNVNIGTGGANTFGGAAAVYDTIRNAYDNGIITNSGTGVVDIQNNIIGNVSYYRNAGDRTAGINISAGTATIRNNTIRDFNVYGTGTAFSFLPVGILISTATSGNLVEGNQIYNIRNTNTGTSAYTTAGIVISGAVTGTTVSKNNIYNILGDGTGTGTSSPRIFGIYNSSGSVTYSNNMIGVGNTAGLESRITGIEDAGTGTNNYYFNSVSVTGTNSAGANNSYAFNRSGLATVDIKNNIFSNTRSGGTGFHVAIANSNAAATGWAATASNYNDLYTSTPSTLGQWLGTALANNRDFTGWKAAQGAGTPGSGGDANSFNVIPGFVSATNLHIPAATSGPLESGGTPAGGITTDIDNDTRPGPSGSTNGGATQVDIGADEFDGIPASNMTYISSTTTQANVSNVATNTTNQQVIGIEIVTTGALNPLNVTSFTLNTNGTTNVADIANAKLWYTGTSSTFATTTQVGSTVAAPNGSFPITATQALAEGTNYFWLTYDVPCSATATNVIDAECNSLTVGSAQTPTVQAPAGSRTIVTGPLSGTYTVGGGGAYATLTDAIADVNTKGLAGNTTFSILNSLTEAGAMTITQWTECGAGNYTLTIKPAAATTPTISTSSTTAVLKLNGADRVIIDGSNNGSASRDMTISNTNTGTSSAVIWVASASASDGANNNIIKNCNLTGNATTTTLMGIFQGGTASISTTGSALTNNAANTYQNNQVTLVQYGIFVRGVDAATLGTGLQVIQNTIGTPANGFGFTGVTVQFQTAALIESNEIQNQVQASTANSGGVIILDNQNSTISKNNIHNLNYTGSSTGKMVGIHTSSATYNVVGSPSNLTISNNIIYDLKSTATSTSWNTSGISNGGGYGDKYYYNTVYLTGSLSGTGGTGGSACFANGNGLTSTNADALDLRNNVFAMTGTSVAAATLYAHYTTRTSLAGFTLNYNSLYVNATAPAVGHYGRFNAVNYTTFANWQAVAGEANSIGVNPLLNSATNLRPGLGSPLLNAGTPLSVLDDITGFTRSVATPTIGAYEQAVDGTPPTITYTPLTLSCSTGDRLLAGVTIADPSTVPTAGALQPRVYYRKNAGTWFSSQGTLMTGNGTSGTWDFTISAATMGGLTSADVIDYYVIAQDQAGVPNIGSNPAAGLVATDVNTVTTHPTSPNSTTVGTTLNGTYTVGGGGNYPTLTAAINVYNTGCLTGAVLFNLLDASYSAGETFPISINSNATASATNTLTIRPTQPATVISGSGAGSLITLNGADYVTIDGRVGGAGASQLTITNTNATGSAITFINDATNNNVIYSALKSDNTSTGVVNFLGTTGTTGNDNNTIDNCNIGPNAVNPIYGIYSLGSNASLDNSSITISNNNIFDYFSAASASAGMNINSFSSGWTITNNNFYQTATRTSTASNQHSGVFISNSGTGYIITGNSIGGSTTGAGGTAWTIAGAFTNRFVGISVSADATATTSIQGNTIANFNVNTTSSATTANGNFSGIWVSGGSANIGTTTGNTIGSGTGNGSITVTLQTNTGGTANMISYSGAGTADIRNNTVGSINLVGTTTSIGQGINGIYVSGGTPTIIGNTIGSNGTANSINSLTAATVTQSLHGIQVTSGVTTGTSVAITGNTIANMNQASTGTSAVIRGIIYSGTVQANISSNIIHDITGASANTTVAGGATAVQGICYTGTSPAGATISLNEVYAIRATNTGAVQTNPTGIGYSNPSNGVITRNKIYDITNASTMAVATTPPTAIGLLIRAALGSGVTISNNMISLGNGQTTNTQFMGIINSFITNTNFVYNNTVNIEGAAAAGALPSFCFMRGDNSATSAITSTVDIRNNIFNNTRTGGTGIHYAIGNNYGNAASSAVGWAAGASNYNALNGSGATGYWNTSTNFAGWQAASAGDANSFAGVTVTFVNSAAGNLHLNMGVTPTQLESGGTAGTGITVDYDNDARPGPAGSVNGGATAPDMGADEFDGVPLDLFAPGITYVALTNTTCTANRPFTASASDNSGINVTVGTRPRIYYKRSTDGNVWNDNTSGTDGWKYAEASNAVSPFTFTIDYSLLNGGTGVTVGNNVQYFVVAQDLAATPNVAINSGTFAAAPASVALTAGAFPIGGTINNYSITTGLNTTLTVGAAGNYTSLTGAAGLFNAINTNGLVGNTTVNILDASVTETGAVALNQIQDGGCTLNSYSLVIKPNTGVTATLTGTLNNNALVRILSSNVTIDGSNSGGTTRDLTITNTSTTGPSVMLFGSTGTTPIANSTVKNSIIINGSNTSSAIFVSDAATPGNPGYFNNITVQNNSIQLAFIGVFANAATVAGNGSGTLFTGNDLNTAGANSIRLVGLYAQGVDGVTISNNNIANMSNANAESPRAIWLATGTNAGTVSGNNISTLTATNTGAFNATGIYVTPGSTATAINVSNNTISTLSSAGTGTTFGGIVTTSPNTNITNNTISGISQPSGGSSSAFAAGILQSGASNSSISGNTISNVSSAVSTTASGINIQGASTGVNVFRNNISNIKNTSTTGWGSNGIMLASSSTTANTNVYNNVIYDVASDGFNGVDATDNGYGIMVQSGGGYNIRFNSIHLNTDQPDVAGRSGAINIAATVTTAASLDIRDNIFANTQTLGGRYAIVSAAANTVFSSINYNDYYSAGAVGYDGTTEYANLAAWQGASGGDANSVAVNPLFTSPTNLSLQPTSTVIGAGVTIAGVTNDYTNATRNNPPSMGAYEDRIVFSAKIFLQGAYNAGLGQHRANTAQWTTATNAGALTQPYTGAPYSYAGTESVSSGFFANTGATNDPMDWVLLELRDATTPTTVISRRAAIIREDGMIVDVDGTSSVSFRGIASGNYFVVIRHRNHLGVRSGTTQLVDGNATAPATYDFTTAQAQALQDGTILTNAAMAQNGSVFMLWGGNVNQDVYVRATTQTIPPPLKPSDVAAILTILGGDANATGGYTPGDVNLDGYTRATTQTLPPPAKPSDGAIILSTPLGGNGNATRQEHKVNN
ncbi:MAG TPA: BNR-repeat neuraminidase N-terminal domain-containing protein [Ferruginibacter sp.]|nr:BNR-repeat neuraminidase N-terminal domain-containing protein [Ferruginibacter sp.]